MVSQYDDGEDLVRLTAMDAIELNIDTCDTRLLQLDVKYVLSTNALEESCLKLEKIFNDEGVYIYTIN